MVGLKVCATPPGPNVLLLEDSLEFELKPYNATCVREATEAMLVFFQVYWSKGNDTPTGSYLQRGMCVCYIPGPPGLHIGRPYFKERKSVLSF